MGNITLTTAGSGVYLTAQAGTLQGQSNGFDVLSPPAAFPKISPANTASSQPPSGIRLGWGAGSGATEYQYCLDTTDNDSCDGNWTSSGTSTGVDLGGLGFGTTYYWQVRARNSAGVTEADAGLWWSFTTETGAPGVFTKTSPIDGAGSQPLNPLLQWAASGGATEYGTASTPPRTPLVGISGSAPA